MATLAGDETVEQFPDTRSVAARADESYVAEPYANTYNFRNTYADHSIN